MKKERATTSDEQRERMLISEQIERAAAEGKDSSSSPSPPPEEQGLKLQEGEKIVLSLAPKLSTTPSAAPTGGIKLGNPLKSGANPLKTGINPLKAGSNPLKRPNPLKAAAAPALNLSPSGDDKPAGKKRELSAAERLIFEDQERKRRKMERETREVLV
jgi:DNA/RNA-binding protein KIN17